MSTKPFSVLRDQLSQEAQFRVQKVLETELAALAKQYESSCDEPV